MRGKTSPVDLWRAGFGLMRLGMEAQTVIAFRSLGMMGIWSVPESETTRMVTEKQLAFTRAAMAFMNASARGDNPARVITSATRPLQRGTSGNVARLSKRGFRK